VTSLSDSIHRVSAEDYLRGELHSEVRHEFIDGQIYAMVGASRRHGLIALNLASLLRPRLRGTPCQLFVADMKVRLRIAGEEVFYYPDLVLSCDPEDREDYFVSRPCLIIEVLSEATERIDRREKMLAYQTIPTFNEYLLVAQDLPRVEVYRRRNDWRLSCARCMAWWRRAGWRVAGCRRAKRPACGRPTRDRANPGPPVMWPRRHPLRRPAKAASVPEAGFARGRPC
jgi:Uma2 family endonuclease